MPDEDWMSVAEAAHLSGYHPERVRELVREGRVQGRKVVTVWLVSRKSLLAYMRTVEAKGAKRGPKRRRD